MGRKGVRAGERREAAAGRAGEAAGPPARGRPREDARCPGTLRAEPKTPGPAQQGESAGWHGTAVIPLWGKGMGNLQLPGKQRVLPLVMLHRCRGKTCCL